MVDVERGWWSAFSGGEGNMQSNGTMHIIHTSTNYVVALTYQEEKIGREKDKRHGYMDEKPAIVTF